MIVKNESRGGIFIISKDLYILKIKNLPWVLPNFYFFKIYLHYVNSFDIMNLIIWRFYGKKCF